MKKIKIDPLILIGILLIIISLFIFILLYIYQDMYSCVLNPVEYANNNSENYYWDAVVPIKYYNYT